MVLPIGDNSEPMWDSSWRGPQFSFKMHELSAKQEDLLAENLKENRRQYQNIQGVRPTAC